MTEIHLQLKRGDAIVLGGGSRPAMTFLVRRDLDVYMDVNAGALDELVIRPGNRAEMVAAEGRLPEAEYPERNT